MEPLLKQNLLRSFLLSLGISLAAFVLTWGLFTTHGELGISSHAALSVGIWTFPVAFVCSLLFYAVKSAARRH
jgi:ABC-type antimicrobial peptide transport system permease subunit